MKTLTLRVSSHQSEYLGAAGCKVFAQEGGTIGRREDNDWVLPDPQRYLGRQHAEISYRDGAYYLVDVSTNGVFVNHARNPVGRGNSVQLNDGDSLAMGDYEITVSIGEALLSDLLPSLPEGPADRDVSIISEPARQRPIIPESFDLGDLLRPDQPAEPPRIEQSSLDSSLAEKEPPAEPDHTPLLQEHFEPPKPRVETIPEDWHGTEPVTPERVETSPQAAPPVSEPPAPQPQIPVEAPSALVAPKEEDGGGEERALRAFLQGAGVSVPDPAPGDIAELMASFGALFREIVQGLMEVLRARAFLKREFRVPFTMVRPVENNPLKFSVDVDEALERLLLRPARGYLPPGEAIREGLLDIKDHQVALIEGMRAAFGDLLKRFDPKTLEQKFDAEIARPALLAVGRKSRYWEFYTAFYEALTRETEDYFQAVFGDEFARAYEEQVQRLAQAREFKGNAPTPPDE
jgi:type VI secretion system protein